MSRPLVAGPIRRWVRRLHRAFGAACVACACCCVAGCVSVPPPPSKPPLLSQPTETPSFSYFVYHVKKGDTLYTLGRRFGVPWREILDTNEIPDADRLREGLPLLIRQVKGVEAPDPEPSRPRQPEAAERQPVSKPDLHRGKPSARFWWPTSGRIVRRYRETLRGFAEPGMAVAAPAGTEVYAVADGTVITCLSAGRTPESGWGNVVAVSHSNGIVSWYAHLDQILTESGGKVAKGEPIGTVGSTGAADSPHLAFRMFRNERPVDPQEYLP